MRNTPSKHTLLAMSISLACGISLSVHTKADVLGIYAGASMWQQQFSGEIGTDETPATLKELDIKRNHNASYFIALEHPLPILPNIRIDLNELTAAGESTIDREIIFNNITLPANANTDTKIDLSHIDYTLYYEILDNWVNFDLGLSMRQFDGEASITYELLDDNGDLNTDSEQEVIDSVVPLLYLRAQLDLPFSGFALGASAKQLSYGGNGIRDYQAALSYMTDNLGFDVGFELGYRDFNLSVDNNDNLKADISSSGSYLSLLLHF